MTQKSIDWNARLVAFFINNSRLVWLLIIAISIGGYFSLKSLRREGFPAISPKLALVQTIYPGAPATEIETQVTKPLENAIKDVKNVKEFSSISQNSFSNITVFFDDDADIDKVTEDIQSKIQNAKSNLPKDAESPTVSSFSTTGPAFILGFTENKDIVEIRKNAQKLANKLNDVKGVKSAKVLNDRDDQILIRFDNAKLSKTNISLSTVNQILQASNINLPVGSLKIDNKQQSIVSVGTFESIDDIKNVVIGVNPLTKQVIHLSDIADISKGLEDANITDRFGFTENDSLVSKEGTLISIELTQTADIIKTKDAISNVIDSQKENNSTVVFLLDQGQSTKDQVTEIIQAAIGDKSNIFLLGGLQLLFIAMLLFVNFRAAILSAIAIPISLGFTFIVLALTGIQLNTIVLFSFILVLGLIVDPAIVMVEAIQRYRDLRLKPADAALESGRRYGAALFMAVLTSLIVFIPFGVVSGIFGQIIKYIPLTVVPALIASYFVPMAILPLLAKRFLKPTGKDTNNTSAAEDHDNLSKVANGVVAINRWVLNNGWRSTLILIFAFILVAGSISLIPLGKVQIVQFSTPEDNQYISLNATFNTGLTKDDKAKITTAIEDKIKEQPGVAQFYYSQESDSNKILSIQLKDKTDRLKPEEKSKSIVKSLRETTATIDKLADIVIAESAVGPPESNYQIQTQLYSNDIATLEKAAKNVGEYLKKQEHVIKVDDGFTDKGEPEVRIKLDKEKIAQLQLSSLQVGATLKGQLDQTVTTKFENNETQKTNDVILVNSTKPTDIEGIKNLELITPIGAKIKLSDIASVEEKTTLNTINRYNGTRYVNIQARVDDPKNTFTVQGNLNAYLTPEKISELGLSGRANKGDTDDIAKSFTELGIALVVAIVLTYIVLVLQFKSFSQPGIMLFTVPLSLIGVFPVLWLTGSDLGFLELLGVTILVGIVENVAIFLIDYANQLVREQNITPKEAIIRASGVRFRPILLTKLVALGGLLPLAIESDFWRGLAVVIIAGIGLSGFFSLIIIPILYVWISNIRMKIHKS